MSQVFSALGTFMVFAVGATFAENAVFSRAIGVSRLLKLVDDASVDTLLFGGLLFVIQLLNGPLSYFANLLIMPLSFRAAIRPLVFVLCSTLSFFIVIGLLVASKKTQNLQRILSVLPIATFNNAVFGSMLLCASQSFTLAQTVGFSVGTAVGYLLSVALVNEGQRKLQSRAVPAAFKGMPITLIYIGILALAIYGFTGHRLSI